MIIILSDQTLLISFFDKCFHDKNLIANIISGLLREGRTLLDKRSRYVYRFCLLSFLVSFDVRGSLLLVFVTEILISSRKFSHFVALFLAFSDCVPLFSSVYRLIAALSRLLNPFCSCNPYYRVAARLTRAG